MSGLRDPHCANASFLCCVCAQQSADMRPTELSANKKKTSRKTLITLFADLPLSAVKSVHAEGRLLCCFSLK